jgi:hypothetical protein
MMQFSYAELLYFGLVQADSLDHPPFQICIRAPFDKEETKRIVNINNYLFEIISKTYALSLLFDQPGNPTLQCAV